MIGDAHRKTVEIDQASLPRTRPLWHEALANAAHALRASGDLSVRGAIILLEKLGVYDNQKRTA